MEDTKMKKHVTVVGAIHIGFGILGLIGAVGALFVFSFLIGVVGNEDVPVMFFKFLRVSVPLLIGFMSTLGLVGGIGLLSFQPWARYLVIAIAALGCLFIPIGTLSGVYSLWVLLQDETIRLFKQEKA
jgi:hypothetical protein